MLQSVRKAELSPLFHYQRFHDNWLHQVVSDRTIRLSNPASFNDPWDYRPYFHMPAADDATDRQELINWIDRAYRQAPPDVYHGLVSELRAPTFPLEKMMVQLSQSISQSF